MKNKIIVGLSVILMMAVSCKDDEFLDVNPNPNNLDINTLFSSDVLAESAVLGAYAGLQLKGCMGSDFQNTAYLLSDAGRLGNFIPPNIPQVSAFGNLSYNSSNLWGQRIYVDTYRLINRANIVLDNIGNSNSLSSHLVELYSAEAKFLKALGLFWAMSIFNNGNVPIPENAATTIKGSQIGLSPKSEVLQEIIDLLKEAEITFLNQSSDDRLAQAIASLSKDRVSIGAINSLLGKVYLYNEMNDLAAIEFKKVVESGVYSLVPGNEMDNNFNVIGEFNQESVFEVGMAINVAAARFGDGEGEQPNEASLRAVTQGRAFGGFGWLYTTHFLSNLYKNEVIDVDGADYGEDNLISIFEANGDATEDTYERRFSRRMMSSIAYENDRTKYYTQGVVSSSNKNPEERGRFITTPSRSHQKKYLNWFNSRAETFGASPINERLIRYSDVLLMYAEALLKSEGDAGVTEALIHINAVRQRAGLVTLEKLFEGVDTPPIIKHMTDPFLNTDFDLSVGDPVASDNPLEDRNCGGFERMLNPGASAPIVCGDEGNSVNVTIADEDDLQRIIDRKTENIINALPEIYKLPARDLTAENIINHLFDAERPAEFAFEGHGISWMDLRRRPDGAEARIRELSEIDYQFLTPNIDSNLFTHKYEGETNKGLWLNDYKISKIRGLDVGIDLINNLYLYIPLREIQENPAIISGSDLLVE